MARTFIRTTDLEDAIITSAKLASSAVVTAALADLNVTTAKLADSAVVEGKIGSGAVTSAKIADGAVGTAKLADAAATAAKLAADSVETAKIKDLNVTAAKLAADSVETAKIKDLNVTAAKLAADSVETAKIKDGAVTQAKHANDSVGTAQLINLNVTAGKLADSAVETAKINNLAVTEGKLADGAVATAKIAGAAVTEAKLGDGAVATAKLADNAVTAAKLANDAVDTAAILDGNVTTAKLANNAVTAGKAELSNADWVFGQGRLKTTMSAAPADNEVITKSYFDAYAQGVSWKQSVVYIATADDTGMTLAGMTNGSTYTGIDNQGASYTLSVLAGQRFLWLQSIANSATGHVDNGVYVVQQAGAPVRALDFDTPNEIKGAAIFVQGGRFYDSGWVCLTDGPTIGTTAIAFSQFTGLGQVNAGLGLTKSVNTLNVGAGNGIAVADDTVAVKLNATTPGLAVDGSGLSVLRKSNGGVGVDAGGIFVSTANGVQVDGSGNVSIKLNSSNPGLTADGAGLSAKLDSADGSLDVGASGLKVKDLGIVAGKIAAGAVVEAKLADAAVATAKIADSAVTTAKINALAVTEGKLADAAVATAKIADSAVTSAKIAAGAVVEAKIADGAVSYDKLAANVKSAIGKFDSAMTFTATAGQTTFSLGHSDVDSNFGGHQVFLNGRLMFIGAGNDYTFSDGTGASGVDQIVFTFSLAVGDFVAVCYGRSA